MAHPRLAPPLTAGAAGASQAHAGSELSPGSEFSGLPVAEVVVGASIGSAVAVALPVLLSAEGTVLVVKHVEASARGTVLVLERASDGATVSLQVAHRGVQQASLGAGAVLSTSVIGAGVVLSVAGNAVAFVPNALGRTLVHHERLTF